MYGLIIIRLFGIFYRIRKGFFKMFGREKLEIN